MNRQTSNLQYVRSSYRYLVVTSHFTYKRWNYMECNRSEMLRGVNEVFPTTYWLIYSITVPIFRQLNNILFARKTRTEIRSFTVIVIMFQDRMSRNFYQDPPRHSYEHIVSTFEFLIKSYFCFLLYIDASRWCIIQVIATSYPISNPCLNLLGTLRRNCPLFMRERYVLQVQNA